VTLHTTLLGGGFGRRANPASDYITEACKIAKRGEGAGEAGVDARGRHALGLLPADVVTAASGRRLDATGRDHRPGSTPSSANRSSPGRPSSRSSMKDGIDGTSVEGAEDLPYAIENVQVELHTTQVERADAVVAFGRSLAHRVRRRVLPRRGRGATDQGSARAAPRRCWPARTATWAC
jgi:isoquinoline 1-oxidoreductase beta subunit